MNFTEEYAKVIDEVTASLSEIYCDLRIFADKCVIKGFIPPHPGDIIRNAVFLPETLSLTNKSMIQKEFNEEIEENKIEKIDFFEKLEKNEIEEPKFDKNEFEFEENKENENIFQEEEIFVKPETQSELKTEIYITKEEEQHSLTDNDQESTQSYDEEVIIVESESNEAHETHETNEPNETRETKPEVIVIEDEEEDDEEKDKNDEIVIEEIPEEEEEMKLKKKKRTFQEYSSSSSFDSGFSSSSEESFENDEISTTDSNEGEEEAYYNSYFNESESSSDIIEINADSDEEVQNVEEIPEIKEVKPKKTKKKETKVNKTEEFSIPSFIVCPPLAVPTYVQTPGEPIVFNGIELPSYFGNLIIVKSLKTDDPLSNRFVSEIHNEFPYLEKNTIKEYIKHLRTLGHL